ncbi:hypothetical protein LWI28_007127 [Acer negundo]|uniref:Uncharacterized protein n=1 Tax=Acer negundo TaxID=4023 RepID=A0AAD5P190_ACENE|nr:hypothetical protein LWI28_007127 [Acer negundo]
MGERKVLNKYYGPDFDPSKLPRIRRGGSNNHRQMKVRMMLPMTVRFVATSSTEGPNSIVEKKICSSELVIKTDPQNSDYVVESGATRNLEPWRAAAEVEEEDNEKSTATMKKALENRK